LQINSNESQILSLLAEMLHLDVVSYKGLADVYLLPPVILQDLLDALDLSLGSSGQIIGPDISLATVVGALDSPLEDDLSSIDKLLAALSTTGQRTFSLASILNVT